MFTLVLIGAFVALFLYVKVGEALRSNRIDKELREASARTQARIERELQIRKEQERREKFVPVHTRPAIQTREDKKKAKEEAELARLIAEYEQSEKSEEEGDGEYSCFSPLPSSYQRYLQSPLWAHIRKAALKRDKRTCQVCQSKSRLQVHHLRYTVEAMYGTDPSALVVLCKACHNRIHIRKRRKRRSLTQSNAILKRLVRYRRAL